MKQIRIKVFTGFIILTSLFCFVYLNTREGIRSDGQFTEYNLTAEQAADEAKEAQESGHFLKAGLVYIIKALVLSNK